MDKASPPAAPAYDDADAYRPEPEPERKPLFWCDGSLRVGIHTSIAGDLTGALESARKLGCNALQIFSGSPRMWPRAGARISDAAAAQFRARRAELRLGPLVIHANYLINLAAPDRMMRARSMQAFHHELVCAAALGADFLVLHPGSGRGEDRTQAIEAIAQGLRQAARGIRLTDSGFLDLQRGGLRILVENTAGMGAAIGSRFEELRAILDRVPELPLGVCLDTAHAFQAGYAIHTEAGLVQTLAALDRTVGLDRVAIVHLNDSKTAFGSRVDRHQHIGRGKIGRRAFQRILTHPRLSAAVTGGVPGRGFILETPVDAPGDDRRNVRVVWALAGVRATQAPRAANGFSMLRARKAIKRAGPQGARSTTRAGTKLRAVKVRSRAKQKQTKQRRKRSEAGFVAARTPRATAILAGRAGDAALKKRKG